MATSKVPAVPFSAQSSNLFHVISADQISRYAEISSLVSGLEAKQKSLREELLNLYRSGAEQEETSPYLLNFVEQERRNIDWKKQAFALAVKVFGVEGVTKWHAELEQSAPVTPITQIRVKPNAAFAAGLTLKKPASSVGRSQ